MAEQKSEFQNKIERVEVILTKALEENKLTLRYDIDFPKYRVLPTALQLVMQLLQDEGGIITKVYEAKKEYPDHKAPKNPKKKNK